MISELTGSTRRSTKVAATIGALALGASSCGFTGLAFREDTRLDISAPKDRSDVTLPVTVSWTVEDFEVTGRTGRRGGGAGSFGVFVDRAPQSPGQTVESLFEDDEVCKARPGCPDPAYLANRGVYETTSTNLTFERLRDLGRGASRDTHEVVVVLLDGTGARIGESAFRVAFDVKRDDDE